MSRFLALPRACSTVGAWTALAVFGAVLGFIAGRYMLGQPTRDDPYDPRDPYDVEPFGALRGPRVPVTTDDGVELHVEVDEPATRAAPPELTVVFSHGYALDHTIWHFQRRDLRGSARLVFWDHRSHGHSARAPAESVRIERLGQDLGAIVDTVAPDGPVVLVGHSMGGMAILSLVEQRPELLDDRVVGIGLLNTSARGLERATLGLPGPLGRVTRRVTPAAVAALARSPELVDRSRVHGRDLAYVITRRYSFSRAVSPSLVRLTARMNASTPIEAVAAFLPMFGSDLDLLQALTRMQRVPTAVLGASGDRLLPVEHSREIAGLLTHADYVEVNGSGHMALMERHDIATAQLRRLLERVRT